MSYITFIHPTAKTVSYNEFPAKKISTTCQYHSTNAPYSSIHLSQILNNLSN